MKPHSKDRTSDNASPEGDANTRHERDGCCNMTVNIKARGDVIINNCCAPQREPESQPSPEECFPPKGACMPAVPGAKHKLSRDSKVASLAAGTRVPSALAAGAMHMMRRFLAGRSAANPLEQTIFITFGKLPRGLLSCTLDAFDHLSPAHRSRLFAPSLALGVDQPLTENALSQALAAEIVQRVGEQLFGDPTAGDQERPGKVRVYRPQGEDFFSQVRICSVNSIRTSNFIPPIDIADRLPPEIQRDCGPQIVNGQTQVICVDRISNCPGYSLGPVCARVLDIAQGETVTLTGVNYFNVDARVRFTSADGAIVREVDAHIWGDIDTPVTEQVGGETRLINDCRVRDQAVFTIPDDLPPDVWQIQVVVPNTTGIPELGNEMVSNIEYINVLVPDTARFEIGIDTIIARQETSPTWAGSDELGLQVIAGAMDRNLNPVVLNPATGETAIQLRYRHDFDSGQREDINRVVFNSDQPIAAIMVVVLGDEIDSEGFYSGELDSRWKLFGEILLGELAAAGTAFQIAGLSLAAMSTAGLVLTGIGAAVLIGIAVAVALWAPADPLIRDSLALTVNDLAKLTTVSLPPPDPRSFTLGEGIVVNVNKTIPPEKRPFEYLETREYVGDDSRYELIYRFNRLA